MPRCVCVCVESEWTLVTWACIKGSRNAGQHMGAITLLLTPHYQKDCALGRSQRQFSKRSLLFLFTTSFLNLLKGKKKKTQKKNHIPLGMRLLWSPLCHEMFQFVRFSNNNEKVINPQNTSVLLSRFNNSNSVYHPNKWKDERLRRGEKKERRLQCVPQERETGSNSNQGHF